MKRLIVFSLFLLILAGCARTYHVYNFVGDGATMTQTIEVLAEVPKTTNMDIAADTEVGGL